MKRKIPADPFTINVPDGEIADLKERLARARVPHEPEGNEDWEYGTNLNYMERLIAYWHDEFDWRAQESWLNSFNHFIATIEGEDDGFSGEDHRVHFVYERGSGPNPTPLILTHGWPSTFREFLDVVDRLAHPERFGGREEDAFDVVVPSLIGYGFSSKPRRPIGPAAMAELWHTLMTDVLGYDRYAVQAGDWGSFVSSRLALQHPESVIGLHLTMLPLRPSLRTDDQPPLSDEETGWIGQMREWWAREEGYRSIQSTKPMALAFGLTDSPVGLAGWLADKYYRLGDTAKGHPYSGMEARFPMDQILTQFSLYWFTGTINSANTLYKAGPAEGSARLKAGERVHVPTGYADYPIDVIPRTPRQWAARSYNIVYWREMDRGGHFAAMEEPALFADDVQTFFRQLRQGA